MQTTARGRPRGDRSWEEVAGHGRDPRLETRDPRLEIRDPRPETRGGPHLRDLGSQAAPSCPRSTRAPSPTFGGGGEETRSIRVSCLKSQILSLMSHVSHFGPCYLVPGPASVATTNQHRPLTRSCEAGKEGDSMNDARSGGGSIGAACRFSYVRRWAPWRV